MELSDFGNQQHTYLCHAKELQDNDMIKKELLKIGAKMVVCSVWMNKWLPVCRFLGFVTMCKNSSKKITSFTIQAFLLFRVMKNSIDLTEGVTCAVLNDTGTLERLIQICQLILMNSSQTTPTCISFKINHLNFKSLK